MKMHRETIHNLNCNLCGFTAVNTVVLYEHTKMHKSNYTCDTCDFRCPVKDDMTEHDNQTHGAKKKKKIFPCEECDDVFEQNGELNEHMSRHHQEPSISSEGYILHNFLKVLAKQREVIITKLQNIEHSISHDIPEIKSQQEALRIEVSDAIKDTSESNNAKVKKDASCAAPTPNIAEPRREKPAPVSPTHPRVSETPSNLLHQIHLKLVLILIKKTTRTHARMYCHHRETMSCVLEIPF